MDRGYWIRSKPIYETLKWKEQGVLHLVIAEGEGGVAVLKLLQQKCPQEPVTVLFAEDATNAHQYTNAIKSLMPDDLKLYESDDAVISDLQHRLPGCLMGTQFYVAGTEAFIWTVLDELKQYGVQDKNVEKEICGSLARPVYCVHCKNTDTHVHHSIHQCSHCGRQLFVRDHFSRRLGAYMGLMVDAEEPGNVPEKEEIYP